MRTGRLGPIRAGLQKVEQASGDAIAARLVQQDADTVARNGQGDINPPAAMIGQTIATGADFSNGEFDGSR
jgi:hypothetical protein